MKKYLQLIVLLLSFQFAFAQSDQDDDPAVEVEQDFAIGGLAALPIGTPADIADYGFGVEFMYLRTLNRKWNLGGTIGYSRYFADEDLEDLGREDFGFLPIAATAMYAIGDLGFGAGLDVGYAIGTGEDNNGGFLYEPKAYLETSRFIFSLGYRGIVLENNSFDTIKFGFAVKLN